MGEGEMWMIGNEKGSIEREDLFNCISGGRGEVRWYEKDMVVSEVLESWGGYIKSQFGPKPPNKPSYLFQTICPIICINY